MMQVMDKLFQTHYCLLKKKKKKKKFIYARLTCN